EGQGMEGPGQGGGGESGGNQTGRLADLQKQIISATWNLQRRQGTPNLPSVERTNQTMPRRASRLSDDKAKCAFASATVAAGSSPAIEPGMLPGGSKFGYIASATLDKLFAAQPGGETPPFTSGETAAATTHSPSTETPSDVQVVLEAQ